MQIIIIKHERTEIIARRRRKRFNQLNSSCWFVVVVERIFNDRRRHWPFNNWRWRYSSKISPGGFGGGRIVNNGGGGRSEWISSFFI